VNKDGSVTSNGKVYSDIYQSWDGNYYSKGGKPTNEKPPASSNSGDKKDTTNAQIGAAYSILYSSNAGGWGNGDVRKRRLKEIFGSDNKVQSYINRIAGGEKISYTGSKSDYSYKALGGKETAESQSTGGGSTGGDTSSKGTNSGSTGGEVVTPEIPEVDYSALLSEYHNNGVYTKKSNIYLNATTTQSRVYSNRLCGNCEFTDGMCYTSNPPKRKCTITGEYHYYDHPCDVPIDKFPNINKPKVNYIDEPKLSNIKQS
jgi:hypothetical protein